MAVNNTGVGLLIDLTDFKQFGTALRHQKPELNRRLRQQLKAAAEIVATDARGRAAEFSTTIPSRIKVGSNGLTAYVQVRSGGTGAARVATLFELGNSTKRHGYAYSGKETFRHPVFNSKGEPGRGDSTTGGQFAQKRTQAYGVSYRRSPGKRHGTGWGWADQKTHPFLRPAFEAKRPQVIDAVKNALDETLNTIASEI